MALREGVLLKQELPSKSWMEQYVVLHCNSLLIYDDAEAFLRGTPTDWTSLHSLCISVADTDDKKTTLNAKVFYMRLHNANRKFCVVLGSRSENARNEWFSSILMVLTRELLRRRDMEGFKDVDDCVCGGKGDDHCNKCTSEVSCSPPSGGRLRSLSVDGAVESTIKFLSSVPKKLHLPRRGRAISCPVDPDALQNRKTRRIDVELRSWTSQEVLFEEKLEVTDCAQ